MFIPTDADAMPIRAQPALHVNVVDLNVFELNASHGALLALVATASTVATCAAATPVAFPRMGTCNHASAMVALHCIAVLLVGGVDFVLPVAV